MKQFMTSLFLVTIIKAMSQPVQDLKVWHRIKTLDARIVNHNTDWIYKTATVYDSDSTVMFPAEFVTKKSTETGIIKLSKKGDVLWTSIVPRTVKGLVKINDKLAVVYADCGYCGKSNFTIFAAYIDPKTGALSGEQNIYISDNKNRKDVQVLPSTDATHAYLVVETEGWDKPGGFMGYSKKEKQAERKLEIGVITDGLSINKKADLSEKLRENSFLFAAPANNDVMFLGLRNRNSVSVIKYDFKSSSSLSLEYKNSNSYEEAESATFNAYTADEVAFAIRFTDDKLNSATGMYNFNFQKNETTELLSKPNRESAEAILSKVLMSAIKPKEAKELPEYLAPLAIIYSNDKLYLIETISKDEAFIGGTPQHPSRIIKYWQYYYVISTFTGKQQQGDNLILQRLIEDQYEDYRTSGFYVKNNKLYIVSAQIFQPNSSEGIVKCINLNSLKQEKVDESSNKQVYILGACTLWFPDSFLTFSVNDEMTTLPY